MEEGRNNAIILNEAAEKSLGLKNPIGAEMYLSSNGGKKQRQATVIGVVKNFHVTSFHKKIAPMFLYINPNLYYLIALRINPRNTTSVLALLKEKWSDILPDKPFKYSFLSQTYDRIYDSDAKSGSLFSIFSFLSIFIACMGLFGLISYTIEVRVKEIGIRKVLGASVNGIVALLSKDFLKLVGIGFLVAVPLAWYAMHKWLEDFAYHINIGIGTFVLAGGIGNDHNTSHSKLAIDPHSAEESGRFSA